MMNALAEAATATVADPTIALADFAARLQLEDVPSAVVAHTKQAVLDTLGVALAGAGLGEGIAEIVRFAAAQGAGTAEATIWSTGQRVAAGAAALANATIARALDYDDILESPQVHVSVCVVPAAFAIAERQPAPVDGKALLSALVVGSELQCRLAAAIRGRGASAFPVMQPTQLFGYFSAAAACGRVLALTPEAMQSAFGLALMQAAGTQEMVVHSARSVGKSLYAAFSNQGGLTSAVMAQYGVLAQGAAFGGQAGLFQAYYGGRYDPDSLVADLGTSFVSLQRCIKAMPGTLVSHAFVEAAQAIMARDALTPSAIAEIRAHVGPWGQTMCEPLEMRRKPPSASAAMNNIPFMVAKAVANGTVALHDFDADGRRQAEARRMAERFHYVLEPALADPTGLEPGVLDIVTHDGRVHSARTDKPRGHPSRPLTFDEVAEKFRANACHAPARLAPAEIEAIIARVRHLEDMPDVGELARMIAPRQAGSQPGAP
jgi:2-methylcitrate dehydratase PrpD